MPFQKRFEEILKKNEVPPERHLWLNTILFSSIIFLLLALYLTIRRGYFDLYIANKVLASASVILIGLSLALSGLCYFWNILDSKIIYRKYLGIIGFLLGLFHGTLSLFFLSDHFGSPSEFLSIERLPTFVPALVALIIFLGMTLISNSHAVHELGGVQWRKMLRWGGYSGFILILFHVLPMKYKGWLTWLVTKEPSPMPPLSFFIVLFALFVLLLRVILGLHIHAKKSAESTTTTA